jgi:hypothetical protein
MKRLALGAAIGVAIGFVLDRLNVIRGRPAGVAPPEAAWNRYSGPAAGPEAPSDEAAEAEVDPDELTSPGTVSDPRLEEQRAREAVERERESRLADETKYEELREEDAGRDAAEIVGDVPEPRE